MCHLGSEEKLAACKDLGADVCINYKTEDFVSRVKEETGGKGLVVDFLTPVICFLVICCGRSRTLSKVIECFRYSSYLLIDSCNCSITGVDVILDNIGGSYIKRNLESLNVGGRLFIIGFMGGSVAEVNLAILLVRRLTVQGNMLKPYSYVLWFSCL